MSFAYRLTSSSFNSLKARHDTTLLHCSNVTANDFLTDHDDYLLLFFTETLCVTVKVFPLSRLWVVTLLLCSIILFQLSKAKYKCKFNVLHLQDIARTNKVNIS